MLTKFKSKLWKLNKNRLRRKFTRRVIKQAKSVGMGLHVNGLSSVTSKTVLGDNVHFNGIKIQGLGNVSIGSNFHSGPELLIITDIHNFDTGTKLPYDESYIIKDVTIEDNVWIGTRVIILGGVTIGEGAIIQAGSCVVSSIPKYAIAGGHPAKVFSQRDIDHYERLKAEAKFL